MIREYETRDRQRIKHLYRDAAEVEPTLSHYEEDSYKPFVYIEKEEVLGVIVLDIPYKNVNIYNLYVDEDHRREGIGEKLVDFAESYAAERDLDGLIVHTSEDNENAQLFYKKLGFERTGRVKNFDKAGETDMFFWKKI